MNVRFPLRMFPCVRAQYLPARGTNLKQPKACTRFAKKGVGATGLFNRARGRRQAWVIHGTENPSSQVAVSIQVNHSWGTYPVSEPSAPRARRLAMLPHARHHRRKQRALLRDRVLRVLVADLVAARTAAGMTQHEAAMRMWTVWPISAGQRLPRHQLALDCAVAAPFACAPGAAPPGYSTSSRYACHVAWPMTGTATTSPTNHAAKPSANQHDDRQAPHDHRRHVGGERLQARQHRDDAVGVAVEHHRHRHDADREHEHGEEPADAQIGEQELDVAEREDLARGSRGPTACPA